MLSPNTPYILLGLKEDLRNDQDTIDRLNTKKQHPVTTDEGLAAADSIGAAAFFEL